MKVSKTLNDLFEEHFYSKGIAVCQSNIFNNSEIFRFRDEVYEIDANRVLGIITPGWMHEGFLKFNTAKIKDVRRLAKGEADG